MNDDVVWWTYLDVFDPRRINDYLPVPLAGPCVVDWRRRGKSESRTALASPVQGQGISLCYIRREDGYTILELDLARADINVLDSAMIY